MIVKIERYRKDCQWWMMDGIKRVSNFTPKLFRTSEEREEVLEGNPDMIIIDNTFCGCGEDSTCKFCPSDRYLEEYKVAMLSMRMQDGSVYQLVFDTMAYILNDQGKTIEKIVVNFPALREDGTKR